MALEQAPVALIDQRQRPRLEIFQRAMCGKRQTRSALERATAYLTRREHSRGELECKLQGKGYSSAQIEQALDMLESNSLLSDQRFMDEYIRNAERKGYGPIKIRWELKHSKQLDESDIDKAISEAEVDWIASARRCHEKKFGSEWTSDSKEHLRRINYLFKRGFPMETARRALAEER